MNLKKWILEASDVEMAGKIFDLDKEIEKNRTEEEKIEQYMKKKLAAIETVYNSLEAEVFKARNELIVMARKSKKPKKLKPVLAGIKEASIEALRLKAVIKKLNSYTKFK